MAHTNVNGLQTEFEFTLPKGCIGPDGTLHRKGRMRLATAMDEIAPLHDVRVKNNPAYLSIAVLTRVVTEIGDIKPVETEMLENLFTADLAYLQDLYRQVNGEGNGQRTMVCPNCDFQLDVAEDAAPGES